MKNLLFCFFIVIVLLNNSSCFGQGHPDTARIIQVVTIFGDTFTGLLVSENQSDLVLITENIGEISLPKEHIKSRKEIKPPKNFDPRKKYGNVAISEKELLYQKLDRAKRLQVTGTFLTIGGSAAITGGYFLMEKGFMVNSHSTPGNLSGDTYTTTGGAIGLLLVMVGIPTVCVGITTLIGGTVKRGIVKKKLEISMSNINTPMSSKAVNGLSFKFTF